MRRLRFRVAGLLLVVVLGAAIAAHHSGPPMDGMHHDGMGAAIEFCLGVLTAAGTVVAAAAVALFALRRLRAPTKPLLAVPFVAPEVRAPAARAGPQLLARICVWRR
jgi:hypothetical protein